MKVLVACEESQRVCTAFRNKCFECFATFPHFDTQEEAIEAWNMRNQ